ncbi:HDL420Cp [Eremothecium sinecaudum]|uniref:pH-response regulator protein palH/RIM21 n=1 Tax=Eremothecium sinecaudum TaxID=45286 RepID=A0A0X8HRV5_9SACH|nr:HDL420Cp [Eremothecium sinecaudum]AMD20324.1 HDL420Cp [Eremothecium sinecaudum]
MVFLIEWRVPYEKIAYETRKTLQLGEGVLVSDILPNGFMKVDAMDFSAYNDAGDPAYSSFVRYADSAAWLPEIWEDWKRYTQVHHNARPFRRGVFMMLQYLTSSLAVILFLTVVGFLSTSNRAVHGVSRLLRFASLLASIKSIVLTAEVLRRLHQHYVSEGIIPFNTVMSVLWKYKIFAVLDVLTVFAFQLCQVQIVMRFYDRVKEKRFISVCGVILSLISQILWIIPICVINRGQSPKQMDHGSVNVLSPFVFLIRVALAGSYASLLGLQIFTKRQFCFQGLQMILLTLLTVCVVLFQPVLFFFDLVRVWFDNSNEIFSTVWYMCSTVIVWEWYDRVDVLEAKLQTQSIMGRPIYEDEEHFYYYVKYALRAQFTKTNSNSNYSRLGRSNSPGGFIDDSVITGQDLSTSHPMEYDQNSVIVLKTRRDVWDRIRAIRDGVTYYTDRVFVKSLGNWSLNWKHESEEDRSKNRVIKRLGLDQSNDTYLYRTKDVDFDNLNQS